MKISLLLLLAFLSMATYSQQNSIVIRKKDSDRVDAIAEHKRIKVVTVDGEKFVGKFTINDSTSIKIDGSVIPLNSIVKIRTKSLFGTIANPVFITVGSVSALFGVIGVVAVAAGAYDVGVLTIFLIPGAPMVLIPAISNNHPNEKWKYSIKMRSISSPSSNEISLGKVPNRTVN